MENSIVRNIVIYIHRNRSMVYCCHMWYTCSLV